MGKTVLLIRNAAKGDFGGAETYQVSLANILKKSDYSPIIVSRSPKLLQYAHEHEVPSVKGWWWSRQDWSGKRILLTPLYFLWQLFLTMWYLSLIIRTRASVLHIQSKDDFIAATIAGRLLGKKVVWTDHMDLRYIFQNIARPLRNPVGKLVFLAAHLAHHFILISNNEYRLVTSHFKRKSALKRQITIVKNGVIDQKDKYPPYMQGKDFVFCLASRIVKNKGIGEAIEAFASLEGNSKYRLKIYGDGPDAENFEKIAEPYKNIAFYGHQSDILAKINEADVFILPSYQEGFSIALLEATMLGKAIIASNVDSNPEIVTDRKTGLLAEVRDTESLAKNMALLATDNHLKHLLETAARKSYEDNFNLDTIVRTQIIPLYK